MRPRYNTIDHKKKLSVDAGIYNPYPSFGNNPRKMTLGRRVDFKPDSNPIPGQYDADVV